MKELPYFSGFWLIVSERSKHFGFTEEELDFIINYDIKYRMDQDGSDEGDE
jgi:hypothetical protein